jgi:hypothetical protein
VRRKNSCTILNASMRPGKSEPGRSGPGGPGLVTRPALFDHAMLPVPSAMPSVPQLCDFVGRHAGGSGRSAGGGDSERLTVSAWHKYAKEHFKMDTGYVQLVFDIFFDSTSDGNMTDNSDIPTAEFAVYLFLLSVSKSVLTPRGPGWPRACAPALSLRGAAAADLGCAGTKPKAARPARCEQTSPSRRCSRRLCRRAAASSCLPAPATNAQKSSVY